MCSRFVQRTFAAPLFSAPPDAKVKDDTDTPIKDRDGFADRRMEGLRSYLESLAAQVQTLAQDQVLEKMLGGKI